MSTHNFLLDVLTPVHIGMGKEKDYIKGLDYIYRDGKYIVYSQQKLLNNLKAKEANAVSSFLASGNFTQFTAYISTNHLITDEMVIYEWPCEYETQAPNDEIKRCVQDGLGNWLIPGSSIKGSLRSIIATALFQSIGNSNEINLNNLLGKIDNNIMRFVQVTDCHVATKPGIFPVKIFSADPNNSGQWKDTRDNRNGPSHSPRFKPNGFVSFYEMLTDGVNSDPTSGTFRINWDAQTLIKESRQHDIPNFNRVFSNQGIEWLIDKGRSHTNAFIEKEIHFFESYPNDSITTDSFLDELKWLKEDNEKVKNGFLLRVGANVGWHSITGDWKFKNYVTATEDNRGEMVGRLERAYKTRKLIFDSKEPNEGDELVRRFALPGFVKLTLQS
jgi:hypothetical protein